MALTFLAPRAKFAPPAGRTLLIAGQDIDAIDRYDRLVGGKPAGYAAYTSVRDASGLDAPVDVGGGKMHTAKLLKDHPNAVLQLAVYAVGALEEVADGKLDSSIDRIGDFVCDAKRPVFLRFGYEFDLPENRYEPAAYVRAYRHFVDRFRRRKIDNVAYVWHSLAQPIARPHMDWYPGDEYVDWVAVSYFDQKTTKELDEVAAIAKSKGKPLMIAEAAPWRLPLSEAWDRWFRGMFDYVERHDVAALSYISVDWDKIPIFKTQNWGDSRLDVDPDLLRRWRKETRKPRFLHSGPGLFRMLR